MKANCSECGIPLHHSGESPAEEVGFHELGDPELYCLGCQKKMKKEK